MPALSTSRSAQDHLAALRTEFADLAFRLERQGRCDAADVVMRIDARVREIADDLAAEEEARADHAAFPASFSP